MRRRAFRYMLYLLMPEDGIRCHFLPPPHVAIFRYHYYFSIITLMLYDAAAITPLLRCF